MRIIAAIDMDGVVYDFVGAVRGMLLEELAPQTIEKSGLLRHHYPDDYNWTKWGLGQTAFDHVESHAESVFNRGTFLPWAEQGLEILEDKGIQYFFLTSPWGNEGTVSWSASMAGKRRWLDQTNFSHIEIVPATTKCPSVRPYDVLIDDSCKHIAEAFHGGAKAIKIMAPSTQCDQCEQCADATRHPRLYDAVQEITRSWSPTNPGSSVITTPTP